MTHKKPKISVIMPFYNCEKYLDESIWSILEQTFSDFEFIIINDASDDKSDRVVKKYLSDKRIIYIKNSKNKGIVENLNYGISISKWEYIARMDGDDISLPERLKSQIEFLEKYNDVDIISWSCYIIDEKWKIQWEMIKPIGKANVKKDLFTYLTLIHGCAMIRKNIYKKVWVYRSKYLYTEDNDWTYRAILQFWYAGDNLDDFIYKYRKHPNSSNKNARIIARKNYKLRKEIIKNWYKANFKDYISMYSHYVLWMLLTWKQKERLEKFVKKLFHKYN